MDLDTMSIDELRALRGQVDRAIAGYAERKRLEARAAAEDVARRYGFDLSELASGAKRGRGASGKSAGRAKPANAGEARYANPADASQTWTGRGRRPAWFNDALKAGKNPDDMTV